MAYRRVLVTLGISANSMGAAMLWCRTTAVAAVGLAAAGPAKFESQGADTNVLLDAASCAMQSMCSPGSATTTLALRLPCWRSLSRREVPRRREDSGVSCSCAHVSASWYTTKERVSRGGFAYLRYGRWNSKDMCSTYPYFCVTANLTTSSADVHTGGPAVALAARLGVAAGRDAAVQRRRPGPCRWRRDRHFPVREIAPPGPAGRRSASTSTPAARWRPAPVSASTNRGRAWEFSDRLIWKRKETLPIPSIVRILLRSAWSRAPPARSRTAPPPTC